MSEGSDTKSPIASSSMASISDGLSSPVSEGKADRKDEDNKDRKDDANKKLKGSNESTKNQLKSVKEEILREFKQVLNKRGRRYIRDELTNIGTAITLRNALLSLVESPENKVEFKEIVSGTSSESAFSSEPTTPTTESMGSLGSLSSETLKMAVHGKPLFFRQAIVHSKEDEQGKPVTIAYENIASVVPPRRTPTKRLSRREEENEVKF